MPIPSVVIEPASSNEGDDDRDVDIISPVAAISDNGVMATESPGIRRHWWCTGPPPKASCTRAFWNSAEPSRTLQNLLELCRAFWNSAEPSGTL
ncbi:hypothetical protein N1851_030712 [Merluccius polli]|uniref:Uncharacterized protein n=1 Tax=Merluccius polli TaxID=89951 RepID=A0AA47NQJ8_MERPO|nr:hypothetical protein N1851_030712 [Merluccius polli]